MGPVFDEPQWKIVQDEAGERPYGYARNVLHVNPRRGHIPAKHIQVPTDAFALLEVILSPGELEDARREGIQFFLDEGENGDWYFGVEVVRTGAHRFLWRYTPAKLPGWLVAKAV